MKKRSCRRTVDQNLIHEKAVRIRKMTDEQLVHYVEDRANKAYSEGYNKALNESSPNTIDWDEIKALMLRVKGIGVVKADAAVSLIRGAIDG